MFLQQVKAQPFLIPGRSAKNRASRRWEKVEKGVRMNFSCPWAACRVVEE